MTVRLSKEQLANIIGNGDNARRIREASACNNNQRTDAYMEHAAGHGREGNKTEPTLRRDTCRPCKKDGAPPYLCGPVRIRVTHYRHKLADSEGYCIKYIVDALVRAGILLDDNAEVIPQRPEEKHYKIDATVAERTVVEVYQAKGTSA